MAEQGEPLSIKEKNISRNELEIKIKKDNVRLMIIYSEDNTYDDFIDIILSKRGWWGKTLNSFLMIYIDNYPICCFNNLNRSNGIDENKEGCKLWNYLASIEHFRICFRNEFYDDSTDFDLSYIAYCKFIANIINNKNIGEKIGYGTLCRIRDGHSTCEYSGFGFLKEKWFTFDLMGSASRIIYNDDYFNHHSSSTNVTLYDYIQHHLNTNQHIPIDINLYNRMNIWYSLYDSKIKDRIDGIIKKGELLNYRNFKKDNNSDTNIVHQENLNFNLEPEPENELLDNEEEELSKNEDNQSKNENSLQLNKDKKTKFNIGDNVFILGSDDIECIIEDINENEQYDFTYVLKVSNYKTNIGPIDMSEIPKLNWIPECLIVKK